MDHNVGAGPRDGEADSQVTAVHEKSEQSKGRQICHHWPGENAGVVVSELITASSE